MVINLPYLRLLSSSPTNITFPVLRALTVASFPIRGYLILVSFSSNFHA